MWQLVANLPVLHKRPCQFESDSFRQILMLFEN